MKALFPCGHGLSYTHVTADALRTDGSTASLTVRNSGDRPGTTVAQLYLISSGGEAVRRLVGFQRVDLAPGSEKKIRMAIDPYLVADCNGTGWTIGKEDHSFTLGDYQETLSTAVTVLDAERCGRDSPPR